MRDWRNLAVVAACVLPFIGFWATGLTDLDEGFYGAVVAHMLRTGDWITPHFNGAPWFEKPVLLYWLAAPSVAVFGEDLGPRLPSVLCTLATALVLFRFVRRHKGTETARVVAVAYCGSLLVVGLGRMMVTDAPFVLALTVAFTTFYESVTGRPSLRTWTAVALGFAVLAKGPVAGLFFLLVAGITFWRMPELRPSFRGHWLLGSLLFLAIVGAWYVPAYLVNREVFVQEFLVEQNLGRFSGGDVAHRVPWWSHPFYFPLTLLLAVLPWTFWASKAKWFQRSEDTLSRYLWTWCLVVVVFFTLSGSKLPHYVLPAVAPFVVLTVVAVLERREDRTPADFWLKVGLAWSCIVFAVATPLFRIDYDSRFAEVHELAKYLREKPGRVVLFDPREERGAPKIKLKLDETSNPSFLFYLRREGRLLDKVEDVVRERTPVWLVTERHSMAGETSQLFALAGFTLERHVPPFELREHEVWLATPIQP